jgi:fucose permease
MSIHKATLVAVHASFLLTGIVTTMLGPILPTIGVRYERGDAELGSLFGAQFGASFLTALLSGGILSRYGYRALLGSGYSLIAAGVAGLTLPGWPAAWAAVAVYGGGLGLVIPGSNLLVGEMRSENRAAALNLLNLCWGMGAVGGPVLLAWLLERGGLEAVAATLGGSAAAMLALVWHPLGAAATRAAAEGGRRPGKLALLAALMLFLYVGVETTVAGWLPALARRVYGLGAAASAAPQSAFWGALLAGRLLAAAAPRNWTTEGMVASGLTCALASILALAVATGLPSLFASAVFAGLGLSPLFPSVVAWFTARDPSARSTASVVFAASGLGGLVWPWLAGVASDWTGNVRYAAGTALPAAAAMAIVWSCLLRSAPPERR